MKKRILSAWIGMILLIAACFTSGKVVRAENYDHYAYISIEKFTLGQGYILEPTKVKLVPGERMYQVLERAMTEHGIEWIASDNTAYGYYLNGIKNVDSGTSHVPSCISSMTIKGQDGVTTAPKDKDVIKSKNDYYPNLVEMSYTCDSGWMYFINNTCPNVGFAGYTIEDGDVIRVQFSLFGIGRDVGNGYDEQSLQLPERAEATKRIALVNDNRALCFSYGYEEAYENAVKIVSDLDSNQAQIDDAVASLPDEKKIAQMEAGLDQEALATMVSNVENLIDSIGSVNLDKEKAVNEAWQSYLSLPPAQKEQVAADKVQVLQEAKQEIQRLKNIQTVEAVSEKIGRINATVTLSDESAISEARSAYDLMTDVQKELFDQTKSNDLQKLIQAEKILQELKDAEAIGEVEKLIQALGEVNKDNYTYKILPLSKAEAAYGLLNDDQKEKIDPVLYQNMLDARATINAIYKEKNEEACEKFRETVAKIGQVTLDKESIITEARKAYNRLLSQYQDSVAEEYQTLLEAEQKLKKLKEGETSGQDHQGGQSSQDTSSSAERDKQESKPVSKPSVKVGQRITKGALIYKVTSLLNGKGKVTVIGPTKKTISKVSIPDSFRSFNINFEVTGIGGKAFANCKKLKAVSIGKNITVIGSKSFAKSKKLKKIIIKGIKLKKVGSKAFSGIYKKAVIKVPKKKLKVYKKLLKGKGQKKTVKIK